MTDFIFEWEYNVLLTIIHYIGGMYNDYIY